MSGEGLTADDRLIVEETARFVRGTLGDEPTGHDWWHSDRVRRIASRLAWEEGANRLVVELAALLHDIADYKFVGNVDEGPRVARQWLEKLGVRAEVVGEVALIIETMSFRGARVPEKEMSLAGACVRDADRLDAIGAIGIARTFAYGGFVKRPIHDPGRDVVLHEDAESYRSSTGTTINHFHEKLLLVKDRLVTPAAQRLGKQRHEFLCDFLARFDQEWDVHDL